MNYTDELAFTLLEGQKAAYQLNDLNNRLDITYGIVVDIQDPEKRGRVRVILDEANPQYLEDEYSYEQGGAEATQTKWIDPIVPFRGLQPENLINTRVPVFPRAADPNRLWFGDPVFDKYGEAVLGREANQPRTSTMTRLPIYPHGELPKPGPDNFGCMVVEKDGPIKSDWLCVCLRRKNQWMWIRHIDLAHIHAGQDDGSQGPDTNVLFPHGEAPVKQYTVWDRVSPTTGSKYSKQSHNRRDSGFYGGAK